jgi:hypothetical protein
MLFKFQHDRVSYLAVIDKREDIPSILYNVFILQDQSYPLWSPKCA